MFCSSCGAQTNGASFCPNCGSPTNAAGAQSSNSQVPPVQPAAQPQPTYGTTPVAGQSTNGLAIAALVTSLVCCGPIGLILGLVSLNQINASQGRQGGKGMAIAGIVLGGLSTVVTVILLLSPDFWYGFTQGFNDSYYDY
jgi:Domain of unknown function (DUF4190)